MAEKRGTILSSRLTLFRTRSVKFLHAIPAFRHYEVDVVEQNRPASFRVIIMIIRLKKKKKKKLKAAWFLSFPLTHVQPAGWGGSAGCLFRLHR